MLELQFSAQGLDKKVHTYQTYSSRWQTTGSVLRVVAMLCDKHVTSHTILTHYSFIVIPYHVSSASTGDSKVQSADSSVSCLCLDAAPITVGMRSVAVLGILVWQLIGWYYFVLVC